MRWRRDPLRRVAGGGWAVSGRHEFHEVRPEELAELMAKPPVMEWTYVPYPLTPHQRFRLIEIAHETSNSAIRAAATRLLREAESPVLSCAGAAP